MRQPGAVRASCLILAVMLAASPACAAAFDPEAATQAYLNSVPAAARLKSDAYFEGGYWLILWNALWGIGVSALLLGSGLSARMRDAAFRITSWRFPAIALYAAAFSVVTFVLTLPLDIYQGFFREHAYDLSNQSFPAWAGDDLTAFAVSTVLLSLLAPLVYLAIRAAPRSWWLWGTGLVLAFFVLVSLLSPLFLEPLFNHFQQLPPGPLRDQIVAMARADEIPASNVMQFDNSRQTSRISAHVSGFFGTTQISLNDNLLRQCTPDQVLAVLGHEMGHYVMNHEVNFLVYLVFIVAGGFLSARWCCARLLERFGARWRVHGIDDPAGLPLLAASLTAYLFVLTPVSNSLIRQQEMQADIFGLNLARRPDAFAQVALKLSSYRKLNPSPLEEIVFFDHPSGHTRILTAMRWKAQLGTNAP
jgi:STE24 endopeptidase